MKETDTRRTPNNNKPKRSGKDVMKAGKPHQKLNGNAKPGSSVLVRDSNMGSEPPEVYENIVIHYVDDINRFEQIPQNSKVDTMIAEVNKDEVLDDHSGDLEKEPKQGKEEELDSETTKDSVSSQGDPLTAEDEKVERVSRVPKSIASRKSFAAEDEKVERVSRVPKSMASRKSFAAGPRGSRVGSDQASKPRSKAVNNNPQKAAKPNKGPFKVTGISSDKNSKDRKPPPGPSSESSEGFDDKPMEEIKETDGLDEASNSTFGVASDKDGIDAEENGKHVDEAALNQRIGDMEMKIKKLEAELREVAALEISLYSVVPEHGCSAHKVHTPARRLSRLYIHACKHWTQDMRASIAKNTVSGLVLIAKSCGNDVPRLTFWLSNTIVLKEIISQGFGNSHHTSQLSFAEYDGSARRNEGKSTTLKWKGSKQINGFMRFAEDWQETGTFTAALEKVESWIFSRIVESIWWQALAPHMQSPNQNLPNKATGKSLGPAVGDQQQGNFSINLWVNAFQDAFQRLCPVRAGSHVCGCLPVITRMVMEQCVARLDVAMFNAILRESAHEIPTDPLSDPIVDSSVLPIPVGDLSFGSGAQLKISVGNWSRWLINKFNIEADNSLNEHDQNNKDDDRQEGGPKSFHLLNELSDLLMLPKDMFMELSIRMEVCPSIGLPLIKRILCNFTPDEFCPDPVPGAVLEALNGYSIVERKLSGDSTKSLPYAAAPVVYTPPSPANVAEKVAEVGTRSQLSRTASAVQRKGYTSDEEMEELDSPLTSITKKLSSSPSVVFHGKPKEHVVSVVTNARYELLREVWSA